MVGHARQKSRGRKRPEHQDPAVQACAAASEEAHDQEDRHDADENRIELTRQLYLGLAPLRALFFDGHLVRPQTDDLNGPAHSVE